MMSLAPKIDEVWHCVTHANFDVVCLTETWLREHIHNNVLSINGFNLVRLDRKTRIHGGVCTYIKDSIQFSILDDLIDPLYEVLWIIIRPARLPRGISSIVIGTVYHPPNANDSAMLTYLMDCLSSVESKHPNSGILLLGDFNGLNVANLKSSFNLKQIVKFPTRGQNTLDFILTNLQDFYNNPDKRSPFGLSDHLSIELLPKSRAQIPKQRKIVHSRDLRLSSRLAIRSYLEKVDVPALLDNVNTCTEKTKLFETIVNTGLNLILPLGSKTVYLNDPPWFNPTLKNLIKRRQRAVTKGNSSEFRILRNRVNRERKICRARYYEAKVAHLKACKPSSWWKEVKKLSGMSSVSGGKDDILKSLQHIDRVSNAKDLAKKVINDSFLQPMRAYSPLPANFQLERDTPPSPPFVVSHFSVYMKLSMLNSTKAEGPDGIPAWLLKENADLLAKPITDILNCSYREGKLPLSWKNADIVPVPKQKPAKDVNKDLRPISLTPILSKVAEEFVIQEYVKPAILKEIDSCQYGSIPKSSTRQALISMVHAWTKYTDGNGSTVRVVLFDYKKAFDLIDHTILTEKLTKLDLPYEIICWIVDFLKCRKQRIKLSNDCKSEWSNDQLVSLRGQS